MMENFMKKLVCLLMVLGLVAPVMAGEITFTAVDNANGTFTLGYSSYNGDAPVGIALVLSNNDSVDFIDFTAVDSFFDIYIDAAHDLGAAYDPDTNGGEAVANPNAAGALALPANPISLCMGELDAADAPAAGIIGTIALDMAKGDPDVDVTIVTDDLRGGVVDVMAAAMTVNSGNPITVTVTFPNDNPYAGTCWDNTQCAIQHLGDATCDGRVNAPDLAKLKLSWLKGFGNPAYNCCANFNRTSSVNAPDLAILKLNWLTGTTGPILPSNGVQSCPSVE